MPFGLGYQPYLPINNNDDSDVTSSRTHDSLLDSYRVRLSVVCLFTQLWSPLTEGKGDAFTPHLWREGLAPSWTSSYQGSVFRTELYGFLILQPPPEYVLPSFGINESHQIDYFTEKRLPLDFSFLIFNFRSRLDVTSSQIWQGKSEFPLPSLPNF